ncbi:E3 ubiquitin ligase BIG BROTHER-related [Benincasa hispida]|uniref:E3 ubiquitin ligase BIG BROTHER-related n=1 Tax=Benincasa hispida TaxID=102211 RepID=UPI001901947D|nr:E3 ubiquitin ligase BIG BROTHER-related [Benincasa hispida]
MAFFSIPKLHLQPNMPLPDQTHSNSPSPAPSIPSHRRDDLPDPMDFNPFATIATSADDSLPFETDWFSDSDSDSDRDVNCFVTDLFENRSFTDHLRDNDRGLDSALDSFTRSANDLGISGFEDSGEIESNYIEELWSTFAVESDTRVSEVDIGMQIADSITSGLRVVDVDSDSDSDHGMIGALQVVTGDDGLNDGNWVESSNPVSDNFSFCFQGQRISYEDFEWEEVEERVDERENSSVVVDRAEELSLASGFSNEEESGEEAGRWEILLVMNDIGRNNDTEAYIADQDDYMYAAEYDTLFGQFVENDNALKGSPPAAKSAVENLPLVELKTENKLTEEVVVCAVCKDKFSMEEKVRKLPCGHYYHDDCILPWLNIRNTCPVCRYELPTDDPDYERRQSQRASGGLQSDLQVRYNFELIA